MCGIFGAKDKEKYLKLQKINLERGDFAKSNVFLNKEGFEVHKVPLQGGMGDEYRFPKRKKFDYYIGHAQAPTSVKREFDINTTHPFMVENWLVAHNGVLTNFKQLVNKFEMPYSNPVDTSIIPYILYKNQVLYGYNEVDNVIDCLQHLQGTFGLWFYNINTGNIFLARCGVTLFGDVYENTFSSVECDNLIPLDEGVLFQITSEGITPIGTFDCESPFFTL